MASDNSAPTSREPVGGEAAEPGAGDEILQVHRLVKVYRGAATPAVDGIDFAVGRGEIFGLLGPNGAGKTTVLSIICTLLRPTSGSVTLCSQDTQRSPARLRSLFGLAPQEIALYPSLTARENLHYFGSLYGMSGRALRNRIGECLALVGLSDRDGTRIDTFSGGMKRRANLAVAILHSPRVLFLDEPTVGIDAQSRNLILENIKTLRDHIRIDSQETSRKVLRSLRTLAEFVQNHRK